MTGVEGPHGVMEANEPQLCRCLQGYVGHSKDKGHDVKPHMTGPRYTTEENVYWIIGKALQNLRRAGLLDHEQALYKRIHVNEEADSYYAALRIIREYVEID